MMKESLAKKPLKQKFTQSEDQKLQQLVKKYGQNDWKLIAEKMHNRTSRQCRERWKYYIKPALQQPNQMEWTKEEDSLLIQKMSEYGRKWSQIAKFFPFRTDINVKNRYHRLQRIKSRESIEKNSSSSSETFSEEEISRPPQPKQGRTFLPLPAPLSQLLLTLPL